jgi:hypothetical protein
MPLLKRCSTKAMQANVRREIHRGRPQKQAVAIAYSVLKKACKCKAKKQLTPKETVTCGKKARARRKRR